MRLTARGKSRRRVHSYLGFACHGSDGKDGILGFLLGPPWSVMGFPNAETINLAVQMLGVLLYTLRDKEKRAWKELFYAHCGFKA